MEVSVEIIQSEEWEKIEKNELGDLWDTIKCTNRQIMGGPEEEGAEKYLIVKTVKFDEKY